MAEISRPRPTRADALRNREQILRAAADMLVEGGTGVSLERIARRANVGIATLYRHFPDRSVLLRHVAMDVVQRTAEAARNALAQAQDAFDALIDYVHTAIDLRVGVILPMIFDLVEGDDELFAARDDSQQALADLVRAAHDQGSLREDVGPGDIHLLVIRVARPLPLPIGPSANNRLSHRHAEILLDGLVHFLAADKARDHQPLQVTEVRALPADGREPVWVDQNGYWSPPEIMAEDSFADNVDRSTTNGS